LAKKLIVAIFADGYPVAARAAARRCQVEYARKVVGTIGGDRARTRIYCQMLDLCEQLDQVDREKNSKKAMDLSQQIDLLQKKLGSDFVALVQALEKIDPNSPDGQELASIIDSLDEHCD
jgi:hypothetical protein